MSTVITIPVKSLKSARNLSTLLDATYLSTDSRKGIVYISSLSRRERNCFFSRVNDRDISHLVSVSYDEDLLNIEIGNTVIITAGNTWDASTIDDTNPLGELGEVVNKYSNGTYKVKWETGCTNDSYRAGHDIIKVE